MSGSKGSPHPRTGHPAPPWPPETEEQARALEYERWLQEQQHLAQQQAPQPTYAYPGPERSYPPQQPYPGQPAQGASGGYVPQFERYDPNQPQHRDPYALQPEPPPPGFPAQYGHEPQPPQHDLAPFGGQRGDYSQPPTQGSRAPQVDPQSWDLSHYQPSQIPPGYQDPYAGRGGAPVQPGWQQPAHAHEVQQRQVQQPPWQAAQSQVDAYGRPIAYQGEAAHSGYPAQQGHYDQASHHQPHETDYDAEGEVLDEPRRGPSTLMIVGALVGAIAIGGGLAFAYKQFTAGKGGSKVAQVTRPAEPTKERPQNPGGKTFDHADKTFQNRLTADGQASATRASDVDGAAKKVSTIPITVNRDGTLTPQPQLAPPPQQANSGVPGLVIDGPPPLRGGPAGGAVLAPPPPPPPPAARPAPPAAPRVADLPLPKVISKAPPPATEESAEVEPQRAAVPKKRVPPPRDDLVAQQAGAASTSTAAGAVGAPNGLGSAPKAPATKTSTGGAGFVAVLASKKSRQDALNSFADMHSQYPDLLNGMTPDVREANLADKGVWYRLIVGPPGSREAAKTLCAKLKERGMKDCWPVAY